MPRYFFNICDSNYRPDSEGTVLPDLARAQMEAMILAGDMLDDHVDDVLKCEGWHIAVTDVSKTVLFRLDVSTKPDRVPQAQQSNVYAFRWPST